MTSPFESPSNIFLHSPNSGYIKAELAFGWWEDKN